jgi:hypothetical protein
VQVDVTIQQLECEEIRLQKETYRCWALDRRDRTKALSVQVRKDSSCLGQRGNTSGFSRTRSCANLQVPSRKWDLTPRERAVSSPKILYLRLHIRQVLSTSHWNSIAIVEVFRGNLPHVADIDNRPATVLFLKSPLLCKVRKHVAHLPLICDVAANHLHVTSYARTRDSQPIARLHVAGYFCIIPRLYKGISWQVDVEQWSTSVTQFGRLEHHCNYNISELYFKVKECTSLNQNLFEWWFVSSPTFISQQTHTIFWIVDEKTDILPLF